MTNNILLDEYTALVTEVVEMTEGSPFKTGDVGKVRGRAPVSTIKVDCSSDSLPPVNESMLMTLVRFNDDNQEG